VSKTLDTLKLLHSSGEVIEIRIPKAGYNNKKVYAGFFNDFDKAVKDIEKYNGKVPGIYVILNTCTPALLSRAVNRIDETGISTTTDNDIIKRLWIYIDIDPRRPAGISSTDQEHEQAISKAYSIKKRLIQMGWTAPVICDSGNGASLLFKIDMENTPDNTNLIKNCLIAFDFMFSDEKTEIDLTVFNEYNFFGELIMGDYLIDNLEIQPITVCLRQTSFSMILFNQSMPVTAFMSFILLVGSFRFWVQSLPGLASSSRGGW